MNFKKHLDFPAFEIPSLDEVNKDDVRPTLPTWPAANVPRRPGTGTDVSRLFFMGPSFVQENQKMKVKPDDDQNIPS